MAVRRVIAYAMHEEEIVAAVQVLGRARATESFVVGDIDEERFDELRGRGLVVDDLEPPTLRHGTRRSVRAPGQDPDPGGPEQWLLTLDGPLFPEMRAVIQATGTRLQEYVPPHAYVVGATSAQARACSSLEFVQDVQRRDPAVVGAMAPTAGQGRRGAADDVVAWDLWLTDADVREHVLARVAEQGVPVIGSGDRRIRLGPVPDAQSRARISSLPGVLTMLEHVAPRLFNDVARQLLGLATAGRDGAEMPYTGRGQVVAVADTGLAADHPDFEGRVVGLVALGRPGDPSDPHGHGTHVAGSVLGDGSASGGRYRGTAPGARLFFQSLLDAAGGLRGLPVALSDLFQPAYEAGARIHNNSWGAATQSAYTVDCNDVDDYVASHPDMLVVIAAGNEGLAAHASNARPGFVDWLSIGSPGSCKNALTVGAARSSRQTGGLAGTRYGQAWAAQFPDPPIADEYVSGDPECVAAFSSRGPCDDRRVKPDVVAPGTDIVSTRSPLAPDESFWGLLDQDPAYAYLGGTSMACPLVSGCAALVREYYVSTRGTRPSAALLKATIINGTRWLTGADSVADHRRRPNYHQGFGAVHMPDTLPGAHRPQLRLEFVDSWERPELHLLETGGRFRFRVATDDAEPLRICLAYSDLPGRALQNDLSLLVEAPDGRKIVGNADLPGRIARSDPENNVEIVREEIPVAGFWTVQVFARNLLRPPQAFALVVSGGLASDLVRLPG